ncbi:MAG TPA: glycosyltransferase [Myxococcaceae bacterium]|nr:glycosyltransferase [Myxococcaceae bacterium]
MLILTLLAAAYWAFSLVNALRVVRAVPVLEDVDPPQPLRWPKLTLVIPARNEAAELEGALETRLREDYPDLQLVVVDDRSTDETGAILDRIAARDGRVVPVHVTELPRGWLGKLHAMHQGVQRASGEWILFTDADVHFQPGTLRRAVAYAEARGLDHLAALPTVWRSRPLMDAVIAFCLRQIFASFRAWKVEDPDSAAAGGCGAFNLVKRRAYDRTPGFEWLRMEVGDDVALGQMMKSYGGKTVFLNGRRLIHLRFYESLRAMTTNVEKGAGIGAVKPPLMLALATVLFTLELLPFAAALLPQAAWTRGLALATCAVALGLSVGMNRWLAQPGWSALLLPAGAVITWWMMARASVLALIRGGIQWRGTFYALEELHRGSRFSFRGFVRAPEPPEPSTQRSPA